MTEQQAARSAKATLDFHVAQISIRVQRVAEKVLERPVVMRGRPEQMLRLFTLQQWEQELNVPLSYILRVLLLHWQSASHVQRRLTYQARGLGISISTLTGQHSRKLLEEAIKRDYPNGEQFDLLREKIEQYALSRLRCQNVGSPFDLGPDQFIKEYKARIKKQRDTLDSIAELVSRRAWRGNPFRGR